MSAVSMLKNAGEVDPKVWGNGQVKLIKRAASYREVERILVHPALKKALCEAAGTDREWLSKVRPYFGHYYHFHLRIGCPKGSSNCQAQPPVPGGDGCGAELTDATITVTSLGDQGVASVFGVIFPPQVAIVGFGRVVERPWAVGDQVRTVPVVSATLAADHRASDGHRGGLLLAAIRDRLQEPDQLAKGAE
ncbi:hypothetical protein FBR04_09315, partial [Betaproteobacteria bacterium PRO7]|nr:hypothetical protein [Betaproteobacteria bacterium PRO7]